MSISREIWRRASQSNRRALLRVWLLAPVALGSVVFVLACTQVPWASAFQGYQQRRSERAALSPLLVEAEKNALTFPQVVASNPAHLHKLVSWTVTVQSSTSSYAEGRVSWPIAWTNPERVSRDLMWHPAKVLARVEAIKDDTVWLEYLGEP